MKPGDLAPEFTLPDQDGTDRKLSALLEDGPVVLFFYPAAMTNVCRLTGIGPNRRRTPYCSATSPPTSASSG